MKHAEVLERGKGCGRRRKRPVFGCALMLLSMIACDRADTSKQQKPETPAKVVVAKVTNAGVVEQRGFFGNVVAASNANLSAGEAGRVRTVHVDEGDRVEKGQLLVELDDQLARVQLEEAVATRRRTETDEEQAVLEVERFDQMREERVVSDLEAERKRSEAQSLGAAKKGAVAQVARGAEVLRRHRIVAPFAGTVARVSIDPGDWITPGEAAIQLLTDAHLEVEVSVPARVLDSLEQVESVHVEQGDRRVEATVDAAVNALDPRTRTAFLRVVPKETPDWLRVGSGVSVVFQFRRGDGLTVPRDALVYGVAGEKVFEVVEGKAVPVAVELVLSSDDQALVRSPELAVGNQVVVKGNERLRPGQPVTTQGALVPEDSGE